MITISFGAVYLILGFVILMAIICFSAGRDIGFKEAIELLCGSNSEKKLLASILRDVGWIEVVNEEEETSDARR